MNLTLEQHGNVDIVHVDAARIDSAAAIQFKDDARALIQQTEGRVILNLKKVDFIDSSGLGAVVATMKMLDGNRRLELAALSPNVSKVFRLTRMDKVFAIHEDLAAGLASDAA